MADAIDSDRFYEEVLRLREHIDNRFQDLNRTLQAVYTTRSQCDDRFKAMCARNEGLRADIDSGLARVEKATSMAIDDVRSEMRVLRRYVYAGVGAASVIGVLASSFMQHVLR